MKLTVISVYVSWGNSKETGNYYAMYRAQALTPFREFHAGEEGKKGFSNRVGVGLEIMEPPVSPDFYPKLSAVFQREFKGIPLEFEFETTIAPRGRNTETVISGFANGAYSDVSVSPVSPVLSSIGSSVQPGASASAPPIAKVSGGSSPTAFPAMGGKA